MLFRSKDDDELNNVVHVKSDAPYFMQNKTVKQREVEETTVNELCVEYCPVVLDMEENVPHVDPFSPQGGCPYFCWELNWVSAAVSPFEEGVIHYNFGDTTEIPEEKSNPGMLKFPVMSFVEEGMYRTHEIRIPFFAYTGAPVIPVVLDVGLGLGREGIENKSGLSLAYGAWTDGKVSMFVDIDDNLPPGVLPGPGVSLEQTPADISFSGLTIPYYQYSDLMLFLIQYIKKPAL